MGFQQALPVLSFALLAACKPPAADDYVERIELAEARGGPSAPLADPDATGAIWAPVGEGTRLLYGQPGSTPMLSMECLGGDTTPIIELTRFAQADPQSKALLALIGDGTIARLPVDAHWNGKAWLWVGKFSASEPSLAVFTSGSDIEATIPGAGSLVLNASPLPAMLINKCAPPIDPPADPIPGPVADPVADLRDELPEARLPNSPE